MNRLILTITRAGLERFTAAQLDGDIDLAVAAVGLSDDAFVAAPTLTALPGEFRRLTTVSGTQVGDDIVHMTIRDEAAIGYGARAFGIFLDDGTLFATYAQAERLFEKSPRATFLAAIDIAFPTGDVRELRFGNTDFLNPPATTTTKGVVELATAEETRALADSQRAVTPVGLGKALAGITVKGEGFIKGGGAIDRPVALRLEAGNLQQLLDGEGDNLVVAVNALAGLTARIAADGEYAMAGGVHHKIGSAVGPFAPGPVEVEFVTEFPNACLGVFFTVINAAGVPHSVAIERQAMLPQQFTALIQAPAGTQIAGFDWFAIGR